jgi:hypothetical protein
MPLRCALRAGTRAAGERDRVSVGEMASSSWRQKQVQSQAALLTVVVLPLVTAREL